MVNVLYTAHGSATGGRDGHGATDDKKVDVKLSVPKEMGGDGGVGTNPEQLFATGFAANDASAGQGWCLVATCPLPPCDMI